MQLYKLGQRHVILRGEERVGVDGAINTEALNADLFHHLKLQKLWMLRCFLIVGLLILLASNSPEPEVLRGYKAC